MRIILLGAPGAGKGTHAEYLERQFAFVHVSSGQLLRDAVKKGSKLGIRAKVYMDSGELVPDELVINLILDRIRKPDCKQGFILDGFPRNIEQAKDLSSRLSAVGSGIDVVLYLKVSKAKVIERLTGRRICSRCGRNYHVVNIPPKVEGICDACGGSLYQRQDDREETIVRRLEVYNDQTNELINYYKAAGLLSVVDSDLSREDTYSQILRILKLGRCCSR